MDSVHHIWCPLSSQKYQDLPDGAETTLTVNRGWRGFILRLMGIHLPDKNRVCLHGINVRKESIYPD
ncbi:hypothetical protein DMT32_26600 [Klebsiella variicola]|nr:hypothetical protein DMT32_26600 [Klebsiella variicola]